MPRGFATNLSLAGMTLFLLTTLSSLHPAQDQGYITFYNEKGDIIFSKPSTTSSSKTYLIKTSKTVEEIAPSADRDPKFEIANVNSISPDIAAEVERLIRAEQINVRLVLENVVEIFDPSVFRAMRNEIRDNEKGGGDSANNKEYGGLLNLSGKIIYVDSGKAGVLCDTAQDKVTVSLPSKGRAEFHSHPSGCSGDLSPWPCADKAYAALPQRCGRTQGVSMIDQKAVEGRTGYVFAMRARIIYIYNSSGVLATLPFSFFEEVPPQ